MSETNARTSILRTVAILLVWLGAVALAALSLLSVSGGAAWGLVVAPLETGPGARITHVMPVGAGSIAGLRLGQVIRSVDGQPLVVEESQSLQPSFSLTVDSEGGQPEVVVGRMPAPGFALLAFGAALTFLLLGSVVYRWAENRGVGMCFLLLNAAFGYALLAVPASLAMYNWAVTMAAICAIAAAASLAAFFLWFPTRLRRATQISLLLGGVTLGLSLVYFLANAVAEETPVVLSMVLWVWLSCCTLAAIGLFLARSLRSSSHVLLVPVLAGVLVGVIPVLLLVGLPRVLGQREVLPVDLALVPLGAIPFGFAYAILRHKLFALDAVLRRFLIRIGAAGATLVLFAAVWVLARTFDASPSLSAILAAVVAALAAPPLWLRAPGVLDALIFPSLTRAAMLTGLPLGGDSPSTVSRQTALGIRQAVPTRWVYIYVPEEQVDTGGKERWLPIGGDGEHPLGREPGALTAREAAANQPFVHTVTIRGSKGPVATLVAGPRIDGSPLGGIDREVIARLALWSADALEAALLRERLERESQFRAELSALAGQLAATAHPREIIRLTGTHSARLLNATRLNVWRLNPEGAARLIVRGTSPADDLDAAAADSREPVPVLTPDFLARIRGEQVVRVSHPGADSVLAFALGQMDESDVVVHVTRPSASPPFTATHERRAREIVEHAGGALRRARVAAQAAEAETLREMDRVKSEFMDMVAHDLRGPLSVIWGFLELLEARSQDMSAEAIVGTVRDMRQSTRTMLQMIEDLMTASRLARGHLTLHRAAIGVRPFLESLVKGYRTLPRGERLQIDVADDLFVHADETRLTQMVGNIVLNAFRYAPEGDIIVRASRHFTPDAIAIEVEDFGPGISLDEQARVWEKFYRGRQGHSAPQGTGLGLSLVRTLADLHGGRAELVSEPGRGSTFRLILPEWHNPVVPERADRSDGSSSPDGPESVGPSGSSRKPHASLLMTTLRTARAQVG